MERIDTFQARLWNIEGQVEPSGMHSDTLENHYRGNTIVGLNPASFSRIGTK